jgi:hypothetical protein
VFLGEFRVFEEILLSLVEQSGQSVMLWEEIWKFVCREDIVNVNQSQVTTNLEIA